MMQIGVVANRNGNELERSIRVRNQPPLPTGSGVFFGVENEK